MKHKRILVLIHSFQPGGAEICASQLATDLSDRFQFLVAALDGTGPLQKKLMSAGLRTMWFQRRAGIDLSLALNLARLVRSEKCVLIHAHQYSPFAYALLARMYGPKVPILFSEHGRFANDCRRMRRIAANRWLLSAEDRVTAVSESVREALVRYEGMPRHRITIVTNGVNVNYFRPASQAEKEAIRVKLGLRPDWFVIVMVARLDPVKDHATAVRAFERAYKQFPNSRLLIVGDGPECSRIKRWREERGLSSVILLCGEQPQTRDYYRAADCFLLTSISEGMPLSVLEAMSCSLPVVATGCGAVPEMVQDGINGFTTAIGDDMMLAKHLINLAREPELRKKMGAAGRKKCIELYNWCRTTERYAHLYEKMLGIEGASNCHGGIPVFCR